MIRALLAARYVDVYRGRAPALWPWRSWASASSYEQSINSFFADDDPYMGVYQEAAETFGDDNFVFLVYDDPPLAHAAGTGPGLRAGRAGRPRSNTRRSSASSRSMRCRCSGRSTTRCWRSTACPRMARNLALSAAKRAIKNIDLKTNAMTVAGAVRAAAADPRPWPRSRIG